jgi:hypothetical protein
MSNVLIIFVDSLPYALLPQIEFFNSVPEKWSLCPGFGYSVNIHAEMFAGLLPDDVGYFGEWTYDPVAAPGRPLKSILPLLDTVFRPYILNRGLQYLYLRAVRYRPGHAMPNIPLRHLDKFAMQGVHLLDDPSAYPYPSLFTEFPQIEVIPIPRLAPGIRDRRAYEQGLTAIPQSGSLFVPFVDLDGLGHVNGIEGELYWEHMTRLEKWIAALSECFLDAHSQGHVFIISDHGMVSVRHGVYLDIEEHLGRASESTYVYFSDANLLRVWVLDEGLREPTRAYLHSFEGGRLVTWEERQEYGLTSLHFGDFIFVLEEALAFEPSTFARRRPKGMHGYHPAAPGQQAVALHIGPRWLGRAPIRMRDLYQVLRRAQADMW